MSIKLLFQKSDNPAFGFVIFPSVKKEQKLSSSTSFSIFQKASKTSDKAVDRSTALLEVFFGL